MLSVEIIDQIRREEERQRREREAPVLRVPLEDAGLVPLPEDAPSEPEEEAEATVGVVVLDMSQDDVDEYRVARW